MAASVTFDILARDRASAVMNRVGRETSKTAGLFSKFGLLAATGGAIAGAALLRFGKDSVSAFSEAQQAQVRLEDAFKRFPRLADTNIQSLRDLNTQLALKTRFDDDAFASGQAVLAQFKLTGTQLKAVTPLLADYAVKTGRDLPDAATTLGKAFLGNTRALKELGIKYKSTGDQAKDTAAIIDILRGKVGGFAEKEGKTAAGRAEILRNQFNELQEAIGSKLVPILTTVADVIIEQVIPALTSFDHWIGTANNRVLDWADNILTPIDALLTLDSVILGFVRNAVHNMLMFMGVTINAAAKAFGWVPGVGPRLRKAADDFNNFRTGVDKALDEAIRKTHEWDDAVGRMRKEIKLKGDINDLQAKLRTARTELKDPNLTKERKAQIRADIRQLQTALAAARNALASLQDRTVTLTVVHNTIFRGGRGGGFATRQHGGPVWPGGAFVVGERRPELFVPDRPGRIVPSVPRGGGSSGGNVIITGPIYVQGVQTTSALFKDLQKYAKRNGQIKLSGVTP